jgi:hypothetical protein
MKSIIVFSATLILAACAARPVTSAYQPRTAVAAVEAWSDAYNGDRFDQLRLLVHPLRRGHYDSDRKHTLKQLRDWRIDRYLVGPSVRVNDEYSGHEVTLFMHDGRRPEERAVIVVEAKERWWLWNY